MITFGKPILAIETATPVCSVALYLPDGTIHEERSEGQGVHSELTFVFIDRLLKEAGLTVAELGGVLVSRGPGSYTGLRVGSSAVKGLLFQTDIPLYAYNTLGGIATGVIIRNVEDVRSRAVSTGGEDRTTGHKDKIIGETDQTTGENDKTITGRNNIDRGKGKDSKKKEGMVSGIGTITIDAVIDARRNHLYHQAWCLDKTGLKPESDMKIRELEEVLQRWKSGRWMAGTGTERLLKLAVSQGIDTGGLPPSSGTEVISAALMLEFIAASEIGSISEYESGTGSGSDEGVESEAGAGSDTDAGSSAGSESTTGTGSVTGFRGVLEGENRPKLLREVDPGKFEPDYFSGV